MKRRILILGCFCGLCFLSFSLLLFICMPSPALSPDFSQYQESMRKDRYLTIILMDGLGQNVMTELLSLGKLKNIQSLIGQGAYIQKAITSFPSMTGYCFYSFLTGKASPSSDISGLRWFRREKPSSFRNYVGTGNVLLNEDISPDRPLLFERFSDPSSSVNTYLNRAVQSSHKHGWALTTAKYIDYAWYIRAWCSLVWLFGTSICAPTYAEFEALTFQAAIDDLEAINPRIQWINAASIDSFAHVSGAASLPSYHQVIESVDHQIGRYVDYLKANGMWENRILAIVADHGISNVESPLSIDRVLQNISPQFSVATETLNLNPFFLTNPPSAYDSKNVIAAVNGNNLVHLYFRRPLMTSTPPIAQTDPGKELFTFDWDVKLNAGVLKHYPVVDASGNFPTDVIQALADTPGVDHVMYKINQRVFVHSGNKEASVRCTNCSPLQPSRAHRHYQYAVHSTEDPLMIFPSGEAALEDPRSFRDVTHSRREWIQHTMHSPYPFSPPRIFEAFESKAVGDVIITSKPGFDFGKDLEIFIDSNRGGHGTLHAEQMLVSYVLVGPDIKSNSTLPNALPEDIGTTLIRLLSNLNHDSFENLESSQLDGIVLNEILIKKTK